MGSLFPKTQHYKKYRYTEREKGRQTVTYEAAAEFIGNIQPMNQKQIDALEIGRKELGKVQVFTDLVFVISQEGKENTGDKVLYDNSYYEIIAMDYNYGLLEHRYYIAELRKND